MDNNFLARWSHRKLHQDKTTDEVRSAAMAETDPKQDVTADTNVSEQHQIPPLIPGDAMDSSSHVAQGDAVLSLPETETGSIASLLVSEASKAVKKKALRSLFMSGEFHEIDRLNDYDHDYQAVKPLAADVVASMRQWLNETDTQPEHNQVIDKKTIDNQAIDHTHALEHDTQMDVEVTDENIDVNDASQPVNDEQRSTEDNLECVAVTSPLSQTTPVSTSLSPSQLTSS